MIGHLSDAGHLCDLIANFHICLRVGPSQIHGTGVLACAPISKGELLGRFGGILLPAGLRRDSRVLASTAIGVAEGIILAEPSDSARDLSDYLNHGCDPNSGFADALTLLAVKDIAEGEEITIDYAYWEFDENWTLGRQCNCGCAECRGVVSGRDWRVHAVAARCLEWASPFVRRRILAAAF